MVTVSRPTNCKCKMKWLLGSKNSPASIPSQSQMKCSYSRQAQTTSSSIWSNNSIRLHRYQLLPTYTRTTKQTEWDSTRGIKMNPTTSTWMPNSSRLKTIPKCTTARIQTKCQCLQTTLCRESSISTTIAKFQDCTTTTPSKICKSTQDASVQWTKWISSGRRIWDKTWCRTIAQGADKSFSRTLERISITTMKDSSTRMKASKRIQKARGLIMAWEVSSINIRTYPKFRKLSMRWEEVQILTWEASNSKGRTITTIRDLGVQFLSWMPTKIFRRPEPKD